MIQKDYIVLMSRYNAWQNRQLCDVLKKMDMAELAAHRGAFFGSLFGTMNHILWADMLWMSRFCDDVAAPDTSGAQSVNFTETYGEWDAQRFRLDGRMRIWAQTLSNMDLRDSLRWFSGTLNQHQTQPVALCVAHMFNHQTHHRGQISQMLNALGKTPPVSDIIFMPEDA